MADLRLRSLETWAAGKPPLVVLMGYGMAAMVDKLRTLLALPFPAPGDGIDPNLRRAALDPPHHADWLPLYKRHHRNVRALHESMIEHSPADHVLTREIVEFAVWFQHFFHALLAYVREHADELTGLLFYKVDRAARNMKDWIALLELRDRHGLEIICITEPFDASPVGQLKDADLRDQMARPTLAMEGRDREKSEIAELALKVFELAQPLQERWLTAGILEKRALLEILCLNFTLNDATLCPTMRKPFDSLAEGPEKALD